MISHTVDDANVDLEHRLNEALRVFAPSSVLIAARQIRTGDESLLLPAELDSLRTNVPRRLRESGAARAIARDLLREMGFGCLPILRSPVGEPIWPMGVIGSMAHDDTFALVAIAEPQIYRAIGIDIEPAAPLPEELLEMVFTDADSASNVNENLVGRFVFAAKEAVYKASFPFDKTILNFDNIVIDSNASEAKTSMGRSFKLHFCLQPSIVVLAFEQNV